MLVECISFLLLRFDGWGVGPSGGVVRPQIVATLIHRLDRHIAEGPLLVADFVVSAMAAKYGEEWGWYEVQDFVRRIAFSEFFGKFSEPEIPRYTCCEDFYMLQERGACDFALLRREAEIDFTISRRFFRNLNVIERESAIEEATSHIHGLVAEVHIHDDVDSEEARAGVLLDENITAEERGDVAEMEHSDVAEVEAEDVDRGEVQADDGNRDEVQADGPGGSDAGSATGGTVELVRITDDDSSDSNWSFDERADEERNAFYFDFRDEEE